MTDLSFLAHLIISSTAHIFLTRWVQYHQAIFTSQTWEFISLNSFLNINPLSLSAFTKLLTTFAINAFDADIVAQTKSHLAMLNHAFIISFAVNHCDTLSQKDIGSCFASLSANFVTSSFNSLTAQNIALKLDNHFCPSILLNSLSIDGLNIWFTSSATLLLRLSDWLHQ